MEDRHTDDLTPRETIHDAGMANGLLLGIFSQFGWVGLIITILVELCVLRGVWLYRSSRYHKYYCIGTCFGLFIIWLLSVYEFLNIP